MPVWQILLQEIVAMIWYDYAGLILDLAKWEIMQFFFSFRLVLKSHVIQKNLREIILHN